MENVLFLHDSELVLVFLLFVCISHKNRSHFSDIFFGSRPNFTRSFDETQRRLKTKNAAKCRALYFKCYKLQCVINTIIKVKNIKGKIG